LKQQLSGLTALLIAHQGAEDVYVIIQTKESGIILIENLFWNGCNR